MNQPANPGHAKVQRRGQGRKHEKDGGQWNETDTIPYQAGNEHMVAVGGWCRPVPPPPLPHEVSRVPSLPLPLFPPAPTRAGEAPAATAAASAAGVGGFDGGRRSRRRGGEGASQAKPAAPLPPPRFLPASRPVTFYNHTPQPQTRPVSGIALRPGLSPLICLPTLF